MPLRASIARAINCKEIHLQYDSFFPLRNRLWDKSQLVDILISFCEAKVEVLAISEYSILHATLSGRHY